MEEAPAATLRNQVARRHITAHRTGAPDTHRTYTEAEKRTSNGSPTVGTPRLRHRDRQPGTTAARGRLHILAFRAHPTTSYPAHAPFSGSLFRKRAAASMLTRAHGDPAPEMPCHTVRAEAFAACDGELSAANVAAIDRHLADCASCRAQLAADAVFHQSVRKAVSLDGAPPALRERIAQLLHAPATENASA